MEIVSIVESLQPYMTHSDPGIRGKGTREKNNKLHFINENNPIIMYV